jgi:hypothetical protein
MRETTPDDENRDLYPRIRFSGLESRSSRRRERDTYAGTNHATWDRRESHQPGQVTRVPITSLGRWTA